LNKGLRKCYTSLNSLLLNARKENTLTYKQQVCIQLCSNIPCITHLVHNNYYVTENKKPLGQLPYANLKASSAHTYRGGSSCQANDGHILSQKAWCAAKNNGETTSMYCFLLLSRS